MVSRKTVVALTIAAFLASASQRSVAALIAPVLTQTAIAQMTVAQTAPSFPVPDSVPAGTEIRISSGSDNMNAISEALRQGFEEEYTGSQVAITRKNTSAAIQDVLNDNADLAAISRPLTDAEKARGLFAVPVQREKIAVVVGKDNPFSGGLTGSQFAQIFRGEIADWSSVGGTAGPIRLIDRPAASETRQALQAYPVFKTAAFETGANATQMSEDSTAALVEELGADGIGYALVGQLAGQPNLKALELHKTLPSDPNYPFSQPYSFVYAGGASPAMAAFLGYATGSPGQAALSNAGVTAPRVNGAEEGATAAVGTAVGTATADGTDTTNDSDVTPVEEGDAAIDGTTDSNPDNIVITGADSADADDQIDGDRWWWLLPLLPLAGLALLIWAAGRRGAEEKAVYLASTEASPNLSPGSVTDTPTDAPLASGAATAVEPVGSENLASDAPTGLSEDVNSETGENLSDYDEAGWGHPNMQTDMQTQLETVDPAGAVPAAGGVIPPDSQGGTTAAIAPFEADSAGLARKSDSWLDRAKQRINEAAEQVENTATDAQGNPTQKK